MTPPAKKSNLDLGYYDMGEFLIVDTNKNGKFDLNDDRLVYGRDHLTPSYATTDTPSLIIGLIGAPSLKEVQKSAEESGFSLKQGADLRRLAVGMNMRLAKNSTAAGNIPKTREGLNVAEGYLLQSEKPEFKVQEGFLIFSSAAQFLKLPDSERKKQVDSASEEDLVALRAATNYLAATDPTKATRLASVRDQFHSLFAERTLAKAESFAEKCDIFNKDLAIHSLLTFLDVTAAVGLPVDVERIKKLQENLGKPRCNKPWTDE